MKNYKSILIPIASLSVLSTLQAATITFSTAQTISAETDVSTNGTLVYAYTYGSGSPTVNGQIFTTTSSGSSLGGGNITLTSFNGSSPSAFTGGANAPYSGLSAAYQSLISGAVFSNDASGSITFNNLIDGQDYEFQFWVNDSRGAGSVNANGRQETIQNVGGAGALNLDFNTSNSAGALGQYVIGTFTADATSQTFELVGLAGDGTATVGSAQMNSIQLRAVPEPSQLTLIGLAGLTMILRRRR